MKRDKERNLSLVDGHVPDDYGKATPARWEALVPYLVEFLVRQDETEVHWPQRFRFRTPSRSEIARQELKRASRAADEYAQRKHIAATLAGRDLTPLFAAYQGDPFFRQLARLWQIADDAQRLALLEGVGPMLLESAHWQGWMQHLDAPQTSLDAGDVAASQDVAGFCAGYGRTREAGAIVAPDAIEPTPAVGQVRRRRNLSEPNTVRAKKWAVAVANVEMEDWLTTRELVEQTGIPEWKFNILKQRGAIPFKPLRGPKGAPLLWKKSDVAMLLEQRGRRRGARV
jgi:hypothetical protein